MMNHALSADGIEDLVNFKFWPWPSTFALGNCTLDARGPPSYCDASRFEACVVAVACQPWCAAPVHAFMSMYEGLALFDFAQCGGSAANCLTQAGFSWADVAAIVNCNTTEASAEKAFQEAMAHGWEKFQTGFGFPQSYIDGKRVEDAESILPQLCQALSLGGPKLSAPPACGTSRLLVRMSFAWPVQALNISAIQDWFPIALSRATAHVLGGASAEGLVLHFNFEPPQLIGGHAVLLAHCATHTALISSMIEAPSGQHFPDLLARYLARTPGTGFVNITKADIVASASPDSTPPVHI